MRSTFRVGDRQIGDGHPAFVIAEAGSNHDRDERKALALIEAAARAGADAVKFQTFRADAIVARTDHPIAVLGDDFGRFGRTVHEMFQKVEMPVEWLPRLRDHAARLGLLFLSTPFDEESADILDAIGVPAFKIASYELVHLPLLRHVARKGKPILLSTGMASLGEIEEALDAIASEGNDRVALFHCAIGYPAKPEDVHLAAMQTLRQAFGVPVGFSDHTLGVPVPIAAVTLGATMIEKHFTLDNSRAGPDHAFAAEPEVLAAMIAGIRDAERSVGDPEKRCQPSEALHYQRGRRSLFAAVDIESGQVITREMVAVLRPGVGLKPNCLDTIVGRPARRRIGAFQPLSWDDV